MDEEQTTTQNETKRSITKITNGIKSYLTDWKNLLAHAIVGVAILVIAIFLPVDIHIRMGFLLVVIIVNILRMRMAKNKNISKTNDPEPNL